MNITTLQERIAKANEKITKKQNTIAKYHKTIEKKTNALIEKYNWNPEDREQHIATLQSRGFTEKEASDICWTIYDIENAEEGIENNTKQIEETLKTIAKYETQLASELKKEATVANKYPEEFKELKTNLVEEWTRYDLNRKASLRAKYNELGYKEFMKQYKWAGYDFMRKTEEEIRKDNNRTADALILNLWNRVNEKVGDPTDYDLHLENGNSIEGIALNGIVVGTKGTARVESILAGGYNIQRLHIRVLVK